MRKGIEPETLKTIVQATNIESSFDSHLAVVDNKPKILNLREFISEFLKFRRYCY